MTGTSSAPAWTRKRSAPCSADSLLVAVWETGALRRFVSEVGGPVNVTRLPQGPSLAELADAGVARVSWGSSCTSTR